MRYKIAWGDRSGDGHSMTAAEYVEILSPHGVDEMRHAYSVNCERWGVRLSDIGKNYEDWDLPAEVAEKMRDDGVDLARFVDEYNGSYSVYEPAALAMAFFSHGIPGFQWKTSDEEAVCLVGDYSAVIETETYGYGFLST